MSLDGSSAIESDVETLDECQKAVLVMEVEAGMTTYHDLKRKYGKSVRSWRSYATLLAKNKHLNQGPGRTSSLDKISAKHLLFDIRNNEALLSQNWEFNKKVQQEHRTTMRRRFSPIFGPLDDLIDVSEYKVSKETVARWRKRMRTELAQY